MVCFVPYVERKKKPPFWWVLLSVIVGQIVIYALGLLWLTFQIGFEKALIYGLFPFLFIAALKCIAAAGLKQGVLKWQRG